jgi:ribosomal protein S8
MMTDPVADMLTRIRNATRVEKPVVDMPASNLRKGIAQVLKDEGYIWDFEEIETVPSRTLRLQMKYGSSAGWGFRSSALPRASSATAAPVPKRSAAKSWR